MFKVDFVQELCQSLELEYLSNNYLSNNYLWARCILHCDVSSFGTERKCDDVIVTSDEYVL